MPALGLHRSGAVGCPAPMKPQGQLAPSRSAWPEQHQLPAQGVGIMERRPTHSINEWLEIYKRLTSGPHVVVRCTTAGGLLYYVALCVLCGSPSCSVPLTAPP